MIKRQKFLAKHRSALLVTSDVSLDKAESGASIRLTTIQEILCKAKYTVTIITFENLFSIANEDFYDLVVVYGTTNASIIQRAKRQGTHIWYDACDSQMLLRLSLLRAGAGKEALVLARDTLRFLFLSKLDIVTFISETDSFWEVALKRATNKKFIFSNSYKIRSLTSHEPRRIVFIGDGNYLPNRKALKFIEKIADLLPKDMKVTVLGRDLISCHPKLIMKGYVDKKDLYKFGDIHIAPIKVGAGVKNKVAGPLLYGLNVITTRNGANGIRSVDNLHIAKSAKDFADTILRISDLKVSSKNDNVFARDESSELASYLYKLPR